MADKWVDVQAALSASPWDEANTILQGLIDTSPSTADADGTPSGNWEAAKRIVEELIAGKPASTSAETIKKITTWAIADKLTRGNAPQITETETLNRLQAKKRENDELEAYLQTLKQKQLPVMKPPPSTVNIIVNIRLSGLEDRHDVTVKPSKTVSSLLTAFAHAIHTMYNIDLIPLKPALIRDLTCEKCPSDAILLSLPPRGLTDGESFTIISTLEEHR